MGCEGGVWFQNVWVPTSSCPLRLYNRSEAAAVLHGRHLVVAGNSVSRGLFSTFLNELAGNPSEESQDARQREKLSFSPFLVNGSSDLEEILQRPFRLVRL